MIKFWQKLSLKKLYPLFFGLILVSCVAVAVGFIKKAGYHITYAATSSMPRGFYLVVPVKKIMRYDIVEFMPPLTVLDFLKKRNWVPSSGLLVKYVFAIPGDDVCIRSGAVWINNKKIGKVYRFYAGEKKLPQTKICGRLKSDQYLLLSNRKQRSFDGRYFGAISSHNILGRAIPLFIKDFKFIPRGLPRDKAMGESGVHTPDEVKNLIS